MYALAICGSPRKGGNTEFLLNTALDRLAEKSWETELVRVGGREVRGCIACYKCFENKDLRCAVDKDMFNEVMAKMVRADALILGSPTYFTDVSAELKAVLDRSGLVSLANGGAFRGKIGAAVVAVRRAGAVHVFDTINHMFQMSQMIVPGSTYWNLGMGMEKGEVAGDAEGIANIRHLADVVAWLGTAIAPHRESYPKPEAVSA